MRAIWSKRGGGQGIIAVIAVVCIGIAAYFIFKHTKSGKDDTYGDIYYYCTNCEKEFPGSSSEFPPIKCKFCGQPTAVVARKFKCSECGKVFIGYLQKYDPQTKALIERRKAGEKIPDEKIGNILVSEPGFDDWLDASTPEATALMNDVRCPDGCEGTVEPVFPPQEKK
jgi:DNA-directed RNA polymerase subunit RPC12/RpoP